MNHVNLIGKVSSNPKTYQLPNGRIVAQFTLATSEQFLDENGDTKVKSQWHRIAAWGRWVQVLKEFGDVGQELAVEGKLTSRYFSQSGQRKHITEVEVNDLVIL